MTTDIRKWVHTCHKWQVVKPGEGIAKLPLTQELSGHRWRRLECDFISGFKTTCRGNVVMMVVQDVQIYPLRDHPASTIAQALVDNWVLLFGVPMRILSDQGQIFESTFFQSMLWL